RSPLESLGLGARRSVVLAQAIVAEPAVLVASSPLSGLDAEDASSMARVFAAACRNRRWLTTVASVYVGSAEHAVAAQADELLVFASGQLVRSGSLRAIERSATGYTLMLRGNVPAFAEALHARGIELSGGPTRYWLELPGGVKTTDLLALALETGTAIVEL